MRSLLSDLNFHGALIPLPSSAGLEITRVIHPANQCIAPHRHDWPCLTIFTHGGYVEQFDGGEADIAGPAVALHPAGATHGNRIGPLGLETLSIQFDPAALRADCTALFLAKSHVWIGGRVGRAGKILARGLGAGERAPAAVAEFLSLALLSQTERVAPPSWLDALRTMMVDEEATTTSLAASLRLHPAWLARAYLHACGESLQETRRRRRVEAAIDLIRTTPLGLADIAAATGFADQSHMNRCFRHVIGRKPTQVRLEHSACDRKASAMSFAWDRAKDANRL